MGSEIAHWLFWQKNTSGASYTAAHTKPSCTSPWLVAPSPKKQMVASLSESPTWPSNFWPIAYPAALRTWLPMTIVYGWNLCLTGSHVPMSVPRKMPSSSVGWMPRVQAMPCSR